MNETKETAHLPDIRAHRCFANRKACNFKIEIHRTVQSDNCEKVNRAKGFNFTNIASDFCLALCVIEFEAVFVHSTISLGTNVWHKLNTIQIANYNKIFVAQLTYSGQTLTHNYDCNAH